MKQYYLPKFISLLLLFSLATGCYSYNKKTPRKSNIVGATVNDNNTSVEIREELDENGNVIKKNYNHPYYFTAGGLTNILSSIFYTQKNLMLGTHKYSLIYFLHSEKLNAGHQRQTTVIPESRITGNYTSNT